MMNTELLERNFGVQFPEELDGTLDLQNGSANCCKFNRWGTLVAVGSTDGRVFIFDFVTKGIVKHWTAHALPISSLSWSRDGRLLLTSSADTTIAVWDVLLGIAVHKLKYPAMVMCAIFNPRKASQILVLQLNLPPAVENFDETPRTTKTLTNDIPGCVEDPVTAISYDRRAKFIITGTSKGKLIIYDVNTLRMTTWSKQNSAQQIRQIVVPRRGHLILTNSQDRMIRTYYMSDLLDSPKGAQLEPRHKVADIVNKAAWKAVCTDSDGDYICGASTKSHSLNVWERTSGTLIKILHGTKGESLLDVQWHPTRPVILSVANGMVSVWTQAHVENWSAFAPEFTELEENAKYVEKEGEFDMEDEDAEEEGKNRQQDSDEEEIDVVSMKPGELLCSSDEEDIAGLLPDMTLKTGPLWFLPITPDIESPEQPPMSIADMARRPSSQIGQMIEDESRKRALPGSKPGPKPRKSK